MAESIEFSVHGQSPPLKGEAKSMLSEGHKQAPRVRVLLAAAAAAKAREAFSGFERSRLAMEVIVRPVRSTDPSSGDVTNALGGIGDALQSRRVGVDVSYLGELAEAFLYFDDAQVREVHYREESGDTGYTVRLWALDD